MSTINKKPFIKSLIEDLKENDGYLEALQLLIDGRGNQTPILRTLSIKPSGNRANITAADAGVCLCNLEANYSLYNGYLCLTDNYCVLIAFTDSQKLTMFAITEGGHNFETIDEELSVLELRSELMDISGGGGSGGDGPKVYEVDDPTAIPDDILNQLKVNDVLIWPDEEAGSSVRGVVTKVIEGVSVEIYSIYDLDDILCYWYWVVDDEWTCGEPTTYALSIILWAESVDDMDSDFVSSLDNNYMIRDDNGKIWLSNIDNNGYIYLYNIGAKSITYVRYAYDDVEETWSFDTSYGVDGYATIPLGATQLYSFSLSDNGGEVIGIVTLAKSQLEHLINEFGDHTATIDNFETKFNANQDYDQKDRVVVQLFSDSLSFGITVRSIIAVEDDQGDDEDEAWFYYIESGQITHYAAKMETLKIHHLMPIY